VLSRSSQDQVYNSSVALLARLMAGGWREQVLLSEERNYDFDFLIMILMYWKKEKAQPVEEGASRRTVSMQESKKNVSSEDGAAPVRKEEAKQPSKQRRVPAKKSDLNSPPQVPPSASSARRSPPLAVSALHDLKARLETEEGVRLRVVRGVGQLAYEEFRNLVSPLTDREVETCGGSWRRTPTSGRA
jgi:hypothetical protein